MRASRELVQPVFMAKDVVQAVETRTFREQVQTVFMAEDVVREAASVRASKLSAAGVKITKFMLYVVVLIMVIRGCMGNVTSTSRTMERTRSKFERSPISGSVGVSRIAATFGSTSRRPWIVGAADKKGGTNEYH